MPMLAERKNCTLRVEGLVAGYGSQTILQNVNLNIEPGEIVAIIGHNGAGKSTLFRAVFGLAQIMAGSVFIGEAEVESPSPEEMLRRGVALVLQGSRVFTDLTVRENVDVAETRLRKVARRRSLDQVLRLFPELKDRLGQRAGTLSGGEKQILSLSIALIGSPSILLLDEPSLGLAPPLVKRIMERIETIRKETGAGVALIEQNVRAGLSIAKRAYVLRNGECSFEGPACVLLSEERTLRKAFL